MRGLIKVIVVLAVIAGIYMAYQVFVNKKKPGEVVKEVQQSAEKGNLAKGETLFKVSKYKDALGQFELALKDKEATKDDHAQAARRIGDCYYKMWEWENNAAAVSKAASAYAYYQKNFPDDYKKNGGYITKNLEKMGAMTGGRR